MDNLIVIAIMFGALYLYMKKKIKNQKQVAMDEKRDLQFLLNKQSKENLQCTEELLAKKDELENTIYELQNIISTQETTISNLTPKIYTEDEKANMKKYGDEFEKKVGKFYEDQGYEVDYRGLELGYEDQGIDLIAKRWGETILVQCKYWKKSNSISPALIKEFYGNCNFYIDNYDLNRDKVVCVYAIAEQKSLSPFAYKLFQTNYKKCRYELI